MWAAIADGNSIKDVEEGTLAFCLLAFTLADKFLWLLYLFVQLSGASDVN